MGEVLEIYYNIIIIYLIFIFFILFFLSYFLFTFWTSKVIVNHTLEFLFFLFPIFLLSLFLLFSIKALYIREKLFGEIYSFKLTGNQWYWSIELKDKIINSYILDFNINYNLRNIDTSNHIFIPVNVPSLIMVSSQDVIHSVGFPDGGVKVDAIPGRLNTLEIFRYNSGILNGYCTELCGPLHAYIPFQIEFIN